MCATRIFNTYAQTPDQIKLEMALILMHMFDESVVLPEKLVEAIYNGARRLRAWASLDKVPFILSQILGDYPT